MPKSTLQTQTLKDLILDTTLENTDEDQRLGDNSFNTHDKIFLESDEEIKDMSNTERQTSATDFALATGSFHYWAGETVTGKKGTSARFLRSAFSKYDVNAVHDYGARDYYDTNASEPGVCPALNLNLSSLISARSASRGIFPITPVKDTHGATIYRTIEAGYYPKSRVKDQAVLDTAFRLGHLQQTGVEYPGYYENDKVVWFKEYEYGGEKYVQVKVKRFEEGNFYADGTKVERDGTLVWFKVEPITWKIMNWEDMPPSINPNGSGKATLMTVRTEETIMGGLPFYPEYGERRYTMWQNSLHRALLNGYNLEDELKKGNGQKKYRAPKNFDFSGRGFLDIAFGRDATATSANSATAQAGQSAEAQAPVEELSPPNPYNFVYDELGTDDMLRLYIQSNASVFLHGTSGVGKSARVKQLDPTATRITLRPQMNPEEIDGTLDRETGQFIPPLWYQQLCEKCKNEPDRKHVLFIDELTNVKPTVQSLVYSIVLDRAGKDGLWPLPDNAVVVAAGNESSNNLAAYPLTNALFRRFSHLYYKVNKNDWLDWATSVRKTNEQKHIPNAEEGERAKIHPAIVAYIMARGEEILNQELDEENPRIVTDPRKWEIASNVLYSTKNPRALAPAIGEELTTDFVAFVQEIQVSVEDIVKNRANPEFFISKPIAQKLSAISGLCMAKEEELDAVREFIRQGMGEELLATFDSLWIRNDPERAQIIAELEYASEEESENE